MNTGKFVLLIILLLFSLSSVIQADNNEPAWIYYEKGLYEISKKEYGQALYFFKQALELQSIMPEAEMAIGDIYFFQGEYILAEQQYEKAYSYRHAFLIPEYKYLVLYKMARLYKNWYKYQDMVKMLELIIEDDKSNYQDFEARMKKLYVEKGFDILLQYYRLEQTFAAQAHCDLAWYYYRMHWFEAALMHSILGVITIISEAMRELRRVKPNYQYTILNDFLDTAFGNKTVSAYLRETRLFEHLYYLAAISWEKGHLRNARYIWNAVAASPYSEGFGRNARDQLENPHLEPALQVGESYKY